MADFFRWPVFCTCTRFQRGATGSELHLILVLCRVCLVFAALVAVSASAAPETEQVEFDIPRQRADRALTQFAQQVGMTLVFPFDVVSRMETNELVGRYSVEQGLKILLEGTGLLGATSEGGEMRIETLTRAVELHDSGEKEMIPKRTGFLALILASITGTATAQTGGAQARASVDALSEIIVTARKRDEALIEIPLSVQAFSAQDIENRGFLSLQDMVTFTPGMNFQNMGNAQAGRYNTGIRFRGLEGSASSPSNQTGALFVDGVFILGGAGSIPLNDLAQVEIIKGPQAAYFGRGTFGGAINYVTVDPGDEFSGQFAGQYSPTFGSNAFSVSVDGPLTDRISGRLTVASNSKGSMFTATDGGAIGAERSDNVTATLLFNPTDDLRIKLRAQFGQDNDGPAATTFVPYRLFGNTPVGTPVTINTTNGVVNTTLGQQYHRGAVPVVPVSNNTTFYSIDVPTTISPSGVLDVRDVVLGDFLGLPEPGTPRVDGFGLKTIFQVHSLGAEWSVSDELLLSATAGYNRRASTAIRDSDGYDSGGWVTRGFLELEAQSVELRALYDGGRWRALLGGNYYSQTQEGSIDAGFGVFTNIFGGVDIGPGASVSNNEIDTLGVFGSFELDILDNLTLALEARQQRDEVTNIGGRYPGPYAVAAKEVYTAFLPRVLLSFSPGDSSTVYASYAEGQQPGIVNSVIATLSPAELAAAQALLPGLDAAIDAEKLESWEIGWKQEFAGGRSWVSLSAYDMTWTNAKGFAQLSFLSPDDGRFISTAAFLPGEVKVRGIEAEAHWMPTDNLDLHVTYGFIDAEYRDFPSSGLNALLGVPAGSNFQAAGNQLPRNPRNSGSVSAVWNNDLTQDWSWYVRGDASYFGKVFTDESNLAYIDSYSVLSARLGFVQREDLTIEIFCTNCTNKKAWQTGRRLIDFGDTPGPNFFNNQGAVVQPLNLREIGLRVRMNF